MCESTFNCESANEHPVKPWMKQFNGFFMNVNVDSRKLQKRNMLVSYCDENNHKLPEIIKIYHSKTH